MELESITASMALRRQQLAKVREIVIANAVMIGEIPAPTFEEHERTQFISERFTELGLSSVGIDDEGNVQATLEGRNQGGKHLLLSSHVDTGLADSPNPAVRVDANAITGPGIADNSLGLAVLISLPEIFKTLDLELDHNIILLGCAKSLGAGDLKGLRTFLENDRREIMAGICVEGVHLGRLSYSCVGMNRGEIRCERQTDTSDWVLSGHQNPIITLNRILDRILKIPLPQTPRSTVIIGSIRGGRGYNRPPNRASARFEVRSEKAGVALGIRKRIAEIVDEVSAETGSDNSLKVLSRRKPGSIGFTHPLVKAAREIMKELEIQPKFAPSVGDLSALIFKEIPALTVGITRGTNLHEPDETVEIDPIFTGLAQLTGILEFIDRNHELMKPVSVEEDESETLT